MAVREDPSRVVDEEARTVEDRRILFDLVEIRRQPLKAAVVIDTRKIEMLAICKGHVIVELIADEHHTRFLFIEDLLRVFLATSEGEEQEGK